MNDEDLTFPEKPNRFRISIWEGVLITLLAYLIVDSNADLLQYLRSRGREKVWEPGLLGSASPFAIWAVAWILPGYFLPGRSTRVHTGRWLVLFATALIVVNALILESQMNAKFAVERNTLLISSCVFGLMVFGITLWMLRQSMQTQWSYCLVAIAICLYGVAFNWLRVIGDAMVS